MASPPWTIEVSEHVVDTAADLGVTAELVRVVEATQEIFLGQPELKVHHDSEIAGLRTIVVWVSDSGTFDEIYAREQTWRERIDRLLDDRSGAFHLAVRVRPA